MTKSESASQESGPVLITYLVVITLIVGICIAAFWYTLSGWIPIGVTVAFVTVWCLIAHDEGKTLLSLYRHRIRDGYEGLYGGLLARRLARRKYHPPHINELDVEEVDEEME
jgi:hypothetical protein